MSRAIQCDRCGKCYSPENEEALVSAEYASFTNPAVKTAEMMHFGTTQYLFPRFNPDTRIDLCAECTKAFKKFMFND